MKNDKGERDERTAEPIFEEGPLTPAEPIFDGAEEWAPAPALYDLPTPAGITINSRTAHALETWFEATQHPSKAVTPRSDPESDRRRARVYQQIQWVAWACASVLFVVLFWVVGDGEWGAEVPISPLLVGMIGTAGVGSLCERAATRKRRDYENATTGRDALARGRLRIAQGTPSPPELKLALHVAQTAHHIESSPAFSSDYLSSHRRRINLAEEVVALTSDAAELWNVRSTLPPRDDPPTDGDTAALLGVLDTHERDLVEVWEALIERANALDLYRDKVDEMTMRLTYLDQLESVSGQADRIAALKARTLEHRNAADSTDAMSAELQAVREAIDALVQGMDQDLSAIGTRPADIERPQFGDENNN